VLEGSLDQSSMESHSSAVSAHAQALVYIRRLLPYLQPYRWRFVLGLGMALLAGFSNPVLLAVVQGVASMVLKGQASVGTREEWLAKLLHKVPELHRYPWVEARVGEVLGGLEKLRDLLAHWIPALDPASQGEWRTMGTVVSLCLLIPCCVLLKGGLDFLANCQFAWVEQRLSLDLRRQVFARVMARSLEFFNKRRASDLMQTAFGMTSTSANTAMTFAQDVIRHPVSVVSTLAYLCVKDFQFMLCSVGIFPLFMLPALILRKRARRLGRQEQELGARISGIMMESLAGIRVVKSHAREDYEVERFTRTAREVNHIAFKIYRTIESVGPIVETSASFGIAGGLVYCWLRGVDFDTFILEVGALVLLYPSVRALTRLQLVLQRCAMASSEVFRMFDEAPEIQDAPGAMDLGRATGAVRFENVTYAYQPGAAPAVKGLHLDFEPGKFYALVGESGAGKSTIISLMLRFYDPQQGRILLDGKDIREIRQNALRRQVGIVNQDLFLFHDTIENNIRYGRLEATTEEVREAARIARADPFILRQPQGYQTQVGDKGCNLSGGQLQRVTIARAILRDSPILLLDEATSNLDTDTEQAFKEALRVLRRGRTVVAIAHRFSTILEADQIIVMDQGSVLDRGTHAELMGRCATYERLYRLQFSAEGG
jgi:ABC-type multidrug transport system fused ATPase/permease subunit